MIMLWKTRELLVGLMNVISHSCVKTEVNIDEKCDTRKVLFCSPSSGFSSGSSYPFQKEALIIDVDQPKPPPPHSISSEI